MIEDYFSAKIEKIVQENSNIKTFYFDKGISAVPGQFVMVWIPGVDEKPLGFSFLGKKFAMSVSRRGDFTSKMHSLKEGEGVGIRGPFGKGFEFDGVKKAVLVGGGCGIAILKPVAEELKRRGVKVVSVLGAKRDKRLFFEKELRKCGEVIVCTEDGSAGEKRNVVDVLGELLKEKVDCVYSCGPEMMMLGVFRECEGKKVKCQLALERILKCGLGICGQCAIDGKLVCKDGPVFDEKELKKLTELGKFTREKTGERVKL